MSRTYGRLVAVSSACATHFGSGARRNAARRIALVRTPAGVRRMRPGGRRRAPHAPV